MSVESRKMKGVVGEVGIERDEERLNSFNIALRLIVNNGKPLNFEQADRLMMEMRGELLGKEVELSTIVFPCPVCGKVFNKEKGMKQHMRMVHSKKGKGKKSKKR